MEMTEEMLGRIAGHMVYLTSQISALKIIIVEQLGVNPQLVDKLMQEIREPQHQLQFQSMRDLLFEQLKGD